MYASTDAAAGRNCEIYFERSAMDGNNVWRHEFPKHGVHQELPSRTGFVSSQHMILWQRCCYAHLFLEILDFRAILAACSTSIKVRIAIADIFSIILPKSHRNHRLAKECVVQNLKNFPASPVANYRMGMHYLGVVSVQ